MNVATPAMPTVPTNPSNNPTIAPSSASKPLKLVSTSQTLQHHHLDYVLDIRFDYYGRRFATASGDRTVRVWDLNGDGSWMSSEVAGPNNGGGVSNTSGGGGGGSGSGAAGGTTTTNEWQAHRGAVHRLSWAHPEFGQLLATAGSDHAVVIWEEREGGFKSLATPDQMNLGGAESTTTPTASSTTTARWISKATLSDARRAVTALEFAPRHLGLRLASGSADGCVRIYEALDTMNLNHWKLDGVIEELDGGVGKSGSGSEIDGRRGGSGGGGSSGRTANRNIIEIDRTSSNENMGVSSLSWSTGRFEPPTLVVGYSSGRASIYRYDDAQRSWVEVIRLPGHAVEGGGMPHGMPRGVLDVAWAPNVGRSYHLIATCGKDNLLKVHRVKRGRGGSTSTGNAGSAGTGNAGNAEGAATSASTSPSSSSSLVYEGTEILDRGQAGQAWRCQWNLTGTVLASSGDGGVVRLWKADFQGRWKCVSEIVGDSSGMVAAAHAQNQ